jgi:hypothetical protein
MLVGGQMTELVLLSSMHRFYGSDFLLHKYISVLYIFCCTLYV